MIIYKVRRVSYEYKIFKEKILIYKGLRKGKFLRGEITKIYDLENNLLITIDHKYFMFFSFRYNIVFHEENKKLEFKKNGREYSLKKDNNIYTIKYKIFGREENLFVNKIPVAQYELVTANYSTGEFQISSDNEDHCFIFSVLEIAIDDWGI